MPVFFNSDGTPTVFVLLKSSRREPHFQPVRAPLLVLSVDGNGRPREGRKRCQACQAPPLEQLTSSALKPPQAFICGHVNMSKRSNRSRCPFIAHHVDQYLAALHRDAPPAPSPKLVAGVICTSRTSTNLQALFDAW
jgi:hypothetical protein